VCLFWSQHCDGWREQFLAVKCPTDRVCDRICAYDLTASVAPMRSNSSILGNRRQGLRPSSAASTCADVSVLTGGTVTFVVSMNRWRRIPVLRPGFRSTGGPCSNRPGTGIRARDTITCPGRAGELRSCSRAVFAECRRCGCHRSTLSFTMPRGLSGECESTEKSSGSCAHQALNSVSAQA